MAEIIYAPNGCPYSVPSKSVARVWVSTKGYTWQSRTKKTIEIQKSEPETKVNQLNINTADINDIKQIKGVTVAKAKKIVGAQPNIQNIDQLTDIVDDVDWYAATINDQPVQIILY